ncbi:mechanosensitive ion channel family protein [Capnocytophaga sp. ARDL2]|uniref:mechanosensitive ion channel family protein n=1 Tax=Capnocytophaga sp. ARDL2 TaxID=3238809 RepID=UPI00355615A6
MNEELKEGFSNQFGEMSKYVEVLSIKLVNSIPSIIGALIALFVGLFIIRILMRFIKQRLEARNVDASLRGFLLSVLKFVLYAVLLLLVVQNLGLQTSAILGALSGIVLATGLALQGSLSNFAGGVLILLFRPFEVGDYIENNSGTSGTVEKIDLLYTTLTTLEGIKVYSPNGSLANSVIQNFTKISRRRMDFIIGIGYESNIKVAKEVIIETVLQNDKVLRDDPPIVFVSELADSAINLNVRCWALREDYWKMYFELKEKIKVALDKEGINIPYPQRDIHIINK